MKPPFKADPSDVVLCPQLKREVPVDAYCHGWALREELCHDANECEPYLEYAERRLIKLQAKRRRIRIPPEIMIKLQERARAKGLTPDEYATRIILKNVRR